MPGATLMGMPWNWPSFGWGLAVGVVLILALEWWLDDNDDDLCGG